MSYDKQEYSYITLTLYAIKIQKKVESKNSSMKLFLRIYLVKLDWLCAIIKDPDKALFSMEIIDIFFLISPQKHVVSTQ